MTPFLIFIWKRVDFSTNPDKPKVRFQGACRIGNVNLDENSFLICYLLLHFSTDFL